MPTSPKLLGVSGAIGTPEVSHKIDTENFGRTDGDVGISREIAVDLKSEKNCCYDKGAAREPPPRSPYTAST